MGKWRTITENIDFARYMTEKACEIKDYRLDKRGKAMREMARNCKRGYFIATDRQVKERFGLKHMAISDERLHIWVFWPMEDGIFEKRKMRIDIVAIR